MRCDGIHSECLHHHHNWQHWYLLLVINRLITISAPLSYHYFLKRHLCRSFSWNGNNWWCLFCATSQVYMIFSSAQSIAVKNNVTVTFGFSNKLCIASCCLLISFSSNPTDFAEKEHHQIKQIGLFTGYIIYNFISCSLSKFKFFSFTLEAFFKYTWRVPCQIVAKISIHIFIHLSNYKQPQKKNCRIQGYIYCSYFNTTA